MCQQSIKAVRMDMPYLFLPRGGNSVQSTCPGLAWLRLCALLFALVYLMVNS